MYLNKKININHLILFLSGAVLFLSPIRKLTSLFGFISLQQLIAAFVLLFFSIAFFSGKIYYRKSLVYFISTIFLYDLFLFILHLSSSSLVEFSFIFDRYKFWLFAFILYSIIFTMKSEIFFGKIIILSSAFASSLGILVYFSNLDSLRAISMLDFQMYRAGYGLEFDTNYFAAILSMSLPFHFNFQRYFSNLPGLFKQLQFYTIPVIMFTILLSLSRGAYVTSFLIFFYYGFLALKKGKIKSRTIFLTVITVIIFATFIPTFIFIISSRFNDLFGLFNNQIDGSVLKRFDNINSALYLFNNQPFFGIGIGQTSLISGSTGLVSKNATFDNQYLTILVEQGIGFFLIYYGYIFSSVFKSLKRGLNEFNIALITYFIFCLVYNLENLWNFYFLFALIIAKNDEEEL